MVSNHDREARDNLLRARAPRRDDMLVVTTVHLYQHPGYWQGRMVYQAYRQTHWNTLARPEISAASRHAP